MSDVTVEVQSLWSPPSVERIVAMTHFEDMVLIATETHIYKMRISRLTGAATVVEGNRLV